MTADERTAMKKLVAAEAAAHAVIALMQSIRRYVGWENAAKYHDAIKALVADHGAEFEALAERRIKAAENHCRQLEQDIFCGLDGSVYIALGKMPKIIDGFKTIIAEGRN